MIRRQRRHHKFCFNNSIVNHVILKISRFKIIILGFIPEFVFIIDEDFDEGTSPMMMMATNITIDFVPLISIL